MKSKNNSIWFHILLTMIVCGALVLTGCESKSVLDEDTPADASVTVTASPASIESGTTSIIEATVTANSAGVANQTVTFTVSPSNAGYFTPAIDTTNANGVAAAVFTATTDGNATITCSINDGAISNTTAMTVTPTAQSGDGNIDMNLDQTLLLANGTDTTHVTITIRDANGQPAADSTLITLVAGEKFVDLDGNGYWSSGIDSLVFDANENGHWDAIGIIQSSAFTTGGTGSVTVDYISGLEATTVYIKASVNDNGIVGSVELPVQITPNATISTFFLASDSMQIVVAGTGGIETSILRATGYDDFGNPVPEGLPIIFAIIENPTNPTYPGLDSAHLANVLPTETYTAITNSQGTASCPISSGQYAGTVKIRVSAGTALSTDTYILISAGPPAQIVVGAGDATDCNVPYWGIVNERVEVYAVVSDVYNNPVPDSTVVYFTVDEGTIVSHEERTQDHEGVAYTEWISGDNDPAADGDVVITAETAGGTVSATTDFINSGRTVTLIAAPVTDTITAGWNGSVKYMFVTAWDVNSNPVDDKTPYEARATYIGVGDGEFEAACGSASWTELQLTSPTALQADNSMTGGTDDGVGDTDYIVMRSQSASISIPVVLLTANAYKQNCIVNADPSTIRLSGYTDLDVLIKDRWGNTLGDHTLNMSAATGTITGGTQNTNMFGEASGFRWTAPADSASIGDHTVTITDTDPRGGVVLNIKITVE